MIHDKGCYICTLQMGLKPQLPYYNYKTELVYINSCKLPNDPKELDDLRLELRKLLPDRMLLTEMDRFIQIQLLPVHHVRYHWIKALHIISLKSFRVSHWEQKLCRVQKVGNNLGPVDIQWTLHNSVFFLDAWFIVGMSLSTASSNHLGKWGYAPIKFVLCYLNMSMLALSDFEFE